MKKTMQAAALISDGLSRLAGGLANLCVLIMVMIITYSVASRYILGRPITGAEEVTALFMVLTTFLGLAETLRRGGHIRVDTAIGHLPVRWQDRLRLVTYVMGLLYALVIAREGWNLLRSDFLLGRKTPTLLIPMYLPELAIALGLALLCLVLLVELARHAQRLKK